MHSCPSVPPASMFKFWSTRPFVMEMGGNQQSIHTHKKKNANITATYVFQPKLLPPKKKIICIRVTSHIPKLNSPIRAKHIYPIQLSTTASTTFTSCQNSQPKASFRRTFLLAVLHPITSYHLFNYWNNYFVNIFQFILLSDSNYWRIYKIDCDR